jgi:hypothetical protein
MGGREVEGGLPVAYLFMPFMPFMSYPVLKDEAKIG